MPIDPRIPLQAGQPSGPFGPDLKQIFTLQSLAQQMQARKMIMDQEQQGQNALKQVFSDPSNFDASGTPTPNALRQIGQASPNTYLDIIPKIAQMQQRQTLERLREGKEYQAFDAAGKTLRGKVLSIYDQVATTQGPEAAQKAAGDAWREGVEAEKASGIHPPAWTDRLPMEPPPIEKLRQGAIADAAATAKPLTEYQKIEASDKAAELRRKNAEFARGEFDKPEKIKLPDGREVLGQRSKDTGQWVTADENREPLPTPTEILPKKGVAAGGGLLQSKPYAVLNKDGDVVWKGDAREGRNANELYETGTNKKIEVPEGGRIDSGPALKLSVAGSRESVMQGRVLGAGLQAATALKAVSMMPADVSTGAFGLGSQRVGLLEAPKAMLAQRLTGQDNQIYNSALAGLTRQLAQIETQGLAPSGTFTKQFENLDLRPTDKLYNKMYKMADMRQIVDNGMTTLLSSGRLSKGQEKLAQNIVDSVREAVPFTIFDVVGLANSKNPQETLKSMGVKEVNKGTWEPGTKDAQGRIRASSDPAEGQKQWDDALKSGQKVKFVDEQGNEHETP